MVTVIVILTYQTIMLTKLAISCPGKKMNSRYFEFKVIKSE